MITRKDWEERARVARGPLLEALEVTKAMPGVLAETLLLKAVRALYPEALPAGEGFKVHLTKIANVLKFTSVFDGKLLDEYEVTEQQLLLEELEPHVRIIINRVNKKMSELLVSGEISTVITDLQVRKFLVEAVEAQR